MSWKWNHNITITKHSKFKESLLHTLLLRSWGFPGGSVVKNPSASAYEGLIPGSGRSSREGNDNPPQYSCLGHPMDRGAWWLQAMGFRRVGHKLVTKHHNSEEGQSLSLCMYFISLDVTL